MGIMFAALSAVLYGTADFSGGLATRKSPTAAVLVTSQILGLVIALVAAPLLGWDRVTAGDLLWGALAGMTGAIGLGYLYRGIARGFVAVTAPLAAVTGAAVPVIGGVLLGEAPGLLGWSGIAVSIPAIFLLAYEPGSRPDPVRMAESLKCGLVAGIAFGAFFILISRPSPAAGFWPIAASRAASVLMVLSWIRLRRERIRIARESMPAVAVAGSFDTAANITFVLSAQLELLPVVSVVSSLAPGPTVILGRVLLGEVLTANRITGLLLALVGVALLSL
ncbi:DMT family transporter [Spirochaeta africana]|uniref:Putative membrane protein n=1 Tax=Spirochaeta africana (strain ATCC 700263 / DSM 8902 / Z-7692) TaxID=889378 RepID=H9UFQ3_SPIAZ|nr:DMT family transporter [Spirochaeta africana]AFG36346.1 putative membrane protein [Spirochaeta africana DSM 8902]